MRWRLVYPVLKNEVSTYRSENNHASKDDPPIHTKILPREVGEGFVGSPLAKASEGKSA